MKRLSTFTVSILAALAAVHQAAPAAEPQLRALQDRPPLAASLKAAAEAAMSPKRPRAQPPVLLPLQSVPSTGAGVYQGMLHSTAFVVVEEQNAAGQTNIVGWGSGWVVDRDRKLLVTNHHVVGLARKAKVYFPVTEGKHVVTERNRYLAEFTPTVGTVFLDEPSRDLALLKLDRLPDECRAVPLADDSPSPGEPLYSVGNPGASHALFVFSSGIVRQVYRRQFSYATGQAVDAQIIESQSPINPGDSGGPVVNGDGNLVGVVASQSQGAELFNVFIDVSEVKSLMHDADELWAPATADQFYRRGMQYYDRADYEQAIQDFTAALRIDPKYANALARRGECYEQQKDLDTAAADLEEAAAIDPKCAEAHLGLALIAMERQQWPKAVEEATQGVRLSSNDFRGYFFRGLSHYVQAQYEPALADLERSQKLTPSAQNALYLARTRLQLKDYRQAGVDYRTAIQLNPQLIDAYTDLADIFTDGSMYTDAINLLNEGITANPSATLLYYKRARANRGAQQFGAALNDINVVASTWYAEPLVFELRGWIYEDMHEYDKAAQDYREAIRLAPTVANYHLDLAYLDFALNRLDEADTNCDAAAAIDPKNASTIMLRAMIHFALGKPQTVVDEDVRRAAAIDPQYAKAAVRRYAGKFVTFVNETDEPLEISVNFRGPSVSGGLYWYPAAPGKGKPLVLKVGGHQSVDLTWQGKRIGAVEYNYSARGTVSGLTWNNVSRRTCDDAGYIFWQRQSWFDRLYLSK
jgi:tetratricopeptide (TPR) repeat protein